MLFEQSPLDFFFLLPHQTRNPFVGPSYPTYIYQPAQQYYFVPILEDEDEEELDREYYSFLSKKPSQKRRYYHYEDDEDDEDEDSYIKNFLFSPHPLNRVNNYRNNRNNRQNSQDRFKRCGCQCQNHCQDKFQRRESPRVNSRFSKPSTSNQNIDSFLKLLFSQNQEFNNSNQTKSKKTRSIDKNVDNSPFSFFIKESNPQSQTHVQSKIQEQHNIKPQQKLQQKSQPQQYYAPLQRRIPIVEINRVQEKIELNENSKHFDTSIQNDIQIEESKKEIDEQDVKSTETMDFSENINNTQIDETPKENNQIQESENTPIINFFTYIDHQENTPQSESISQNESTPDLFFENNANDQSQAMEDIVESTPVCDSNIELKEENTKDSNEIISVDTFNKINVEESSTPLPVNESFLNLNEKPVLSHENQNLYETTTSDDEDFEIIPSNLDETMKDVENTQNANNESSQEDNVSPILLDIHKKIENITIPENVSNLNQLVQSEEFLMQNLLQLDSIEPTGYSKIFRKSLIDNIQEKFNQIDNAKKIYSC